MGSRRSRIPTSVKTKGGRFIVRERDYDGRLVRYVFSHALDADECRFVIRRRVERVHAELEPVPLPLTFGQWVEHWMAERKRLRPRATWEPEEARLKRHWLPFFKDRKLATIHAPEISQRLSRIVRQSSNATRNRHRAMLHRIFEEARRHYPPLVSYNPVASIPMLPESWRANPRRYFSEEELRRYCEAAWKVSPQWGPIAEILAWSGIRISEALALRWCDLTKDGISVTRIFCKTEKKVVDRTKGQRGQGGYYALLLPRVAKIKPKRCNPQALISDGMPYWTALRLHRKTLARAGFPRCDIRTLRHSAGRLFKVWGFSRDDIQDLLGHESATTTLRYTKTGIAHLVERALRLGAGSRRKPKRVSKS